MHVNPYGEDPVRLAVSFANRPPGSVAALRDRCLQAGVVIPGRVTGDDLRRLLDTLGEWVEVVDAENDSERVRLVNAMLSAYTAHPRLTDHSGDGLHIHFRDDDCPLWKVLAILFSVGTALHLSHRGVHSLSRCTAADCVLIFADFSRTGTQRYCSTRCANRDAVRRHRSRAAAD